MVNIFILLFGLMLGPYLYADETCISSNNSLTMLHQAWQQSKFNTQNEIISDNSLFFLNLFSIEKMKQQYGEITIKSKKNITALRKIEWLHAKAGEYWIAADSAVWIDVINHNNALALEPLEIERSLRCAGIHKALRFSLIAGDYDLVVASEDRTPVKIAIFRVTN